MLSGLTNKISNTFKETYSKIVAVPFSSFYLWFTLIKPPTESKFAEKGILTPQEFVEAGNQLVQMCPTWQWKPASNDKLKRADLPDDKQFLYTRVPCHKRVSDAMDVKTIEKDVRIYYISLLFTLMEVRRWLVSCWNR